MYQPIRQSLLKKKLLFGAPRLPAAGVWLATFIISVWGGLWWFIAVGAAAHGAMAWIMYKDPLMADIVLRQVRTPSRPWRA